MPCSFLAVVVGLEGITSVSNTFTKDGNPLITKRRVLWGYLYLEITVEKVPDLSDALFCFGGGDGSGPPLQSVSNSFITEESPYITWQRVI